MDTSPNWILTSIQTQSVLGSPESQPLESQLGKDPGQCVSSMSESSESAVQVSAQWVRVQRVQFRVPAHNPRMQAT